jgi:hypothetical protein
LSPTGSSLDDLSRAFSENGRLIVDEPVDLPDGASHSSAPLAAKSSSAVRQVAFSPNGRLLAAGFDHGTVIVFDTQNGRVWGRIELPSQRASFLWWTAEGTRLVIDTTRHFRFEVAPTRRAASTLESRSLHTASARALPQGTNYFVGSR